jgi:hypothetical protein
VIAGKHYMIAFLCIYSIQMKKYISALTFSNSYIDGLETFARETGMDKRNGYVVYGRDDGFTFKGFQVISWRKNEPDFL